MKLGYNPNYRKQIAERNLFTIDAERTDGVFIEVGKSIENDMLFILRENNETTGESFYLCFADKTRYNKARDGICYIDYFDEWQEAVVPQDVLHKRFWQAYNIYKSIGNGEYKNLHDYYFRHV